MNQVLGNTVPAFQYSHNKLDQTVLIRLAEDLPDVLDRLMKLKVMFPSISLASMLGTR